MPDPEYPVEVFADQWNLIAFGVTGGNVRRKSVDPNKYLQTHRVLNGDEPTVKEEGVPMFDEYPNREPIASPYPIKVYVWPIDKNGFLRIDL